MTSSNNRKTLLTFNAKLSGAPNDVFYNVTDCTMTVHQNVCKDYIVECNKPKSSKVRKNLYLYKNNILEEQNQDPFN